MENDHSYYFDEAARLSRYSRFLAATGNQFLNGPLTERVRDFITASNELGAFLSYKFFVFPKHQTGLKTRLCMGPGLNMDRDGDGSPEQSQKYQALTNDLEGLTRNFTQHYAALRAGVKMTLVIQPIFAKGADYQRRPIDTSLRTSVPVLFSLFVTLTVVGSVRPYYRKSVWFSVGDPLIECVRIV